jgi:ABC-type antimicrobial peptide transport system ATPase subunit
METQSQSNLLQEENSKILNQTKKTIVAIGKMGHGKSSFVKMLVR